MNTFFHHPAGLKSELSAAGFRDVDVFGVEAPGWLTHDFDQWWNDEPLREHLLEQARMLESEPSLIGISSHLMAMGKK